MKKNNWLIIILVLVVLCLCLVSAGVIFFLQSAKQAAPATATALLPTNEPTLTVTPENIPTATVETPQTTGASPVIYLAGRSDIEIPPLGDFVDAPIFSCRGGTVQEVYPSGYRIQSGSEFTFKASGMVNFYGSDPQKGYPPDGEQNGKMANIESFGGISAYKGPAGALVGVFLDDNIPDGTAPEPLLFNEETGTLGVNFPRLEPATGQLFFIGDGVNSAGQQQVFVAPSNATRLFIGLADGPNFEGAPGCYSDNSGSFDYSIHTNQGFEQIK